jgi:hypothetical protein
MPDIIPIFTRLNLELLTLLKSLKLTDWDKKIGYSNFTIKDVISQLFDIDSKSLSEIAIIETIEKNLSQHLSVENQLDVNHQYAKNWLAQQQIRFELNNQKLLNREFYFPYLNTVMQALPYTYSTVNSFVGATVTVEIVGDAGGLWSIVKNELGWSLMTSVANNPTALIYIDQQIAWLLFSGAINPLDAVQYYQLHGDTELASHALKLTL